MLCVLFFAALFGIIWADVRFWQDPLTERSATELTQEIFLGLSACMFWGLGLKDATQRGLYILVAGFISVMLIRELDTLFDMVWHGFWVYPALAVTFLSIISAYFSKNSTLEPMAKFLQNKDYMMLSHGMIIVLVFSRLFGMGVLWKLALGDDFHRLIKDIVEEGVELLGYGFIFMGSLKYFVSQLRQPKASN